MFTPPEQTFSAVGAIDAEGRFRLTSERPNDGVPPGHHRVLVAPSALHGRNVLHQGEGPPPPI